MDREIKPRSLWHLGTFAYFVLDYALAWVAVVGALRLSPRVTTAVFDGVWLAPNLRFIGYGLPFGIALGLQVTGLQRTQAGRGVPETTTLATAGILGGMIAFSVVHAAVEFSLVGRFVLLLAFGLGLVLVVGSRTLLGKLAESDRRRAIIIGPVATAETVHAAIRRIRLPLDIVGCIAPADAATAGASLPARCTEAGADELIVDLPEGPVPRERAALLACSEAGLRVVDLGYFFERDCECVFLPRLTEPWFWDFEPAHAHPGFSAAKRIVDIVVGIAGLVLFLPAAPIVMLIIRLQDGGPIFYSQTRVGLRNRPFRILKFRTMRRDAEVKGIQWARENDERATAFGRFLRKSRIDEVPQFWNILRGEMSFIGPRPERPELAAQLEREIPFYRLRHLIKPGLTGWAQVNCAYGASVDDTREKLSYDLHYLKYASVAGELHIVLRTVVAMVRGAR
ncbi:MAG: sugar transferase [Opitutaceae bacterium]|nr:sugar transferase [Opitutaceae bacterium]